MGAGGVSTQNVLGLDLATTSLPDAIAAMVEAWYDAQNVDIEPEPAPSKDLIKCIDYILNQTVKPDLLDGLNNLGANPTIKKLLLIRHGQGPGARSNAGFALSRFGILYRGSKERCLRIYTKEFLFNIADEDAGYRCVNALFEAPGAEYHKDKYLTDSKDYSYIEIPSKYFTDRCSL